MASTALNTRLLEAMVTSRSETTTSSPMNGQETYLAQYTATLEDFARRNGNILDVSLSGGEVTTEDDEGSFEETNGGLKRAISSPLDSAKKRRKQSKPNKIGGSDSSVEGEDPDKDELERGTDQIENGNDERRQLDVLRCPHCQVTSESHDDLRRHVIEQHIGRMITEEEIFARHAQQAKQKFFEQQQLQHQQYQQRLLAEARFHEQQKREEDGTLETQPNPLERNSQNERIEKPNCHEREEGETGPLNLSNSRWENRPMPAQESQRSPMNTIPTSIPIPPTFSDGRFNLPGLLPFGPSPFFLPLIQQTDRGNNINNNQQQGNFNSGQSRIFNLEAFCDLCNKEFCNKYFLKTHKANKHGIFTPEPSCSPMPPTPPTPLGPSTPLGPNNPLMAPLVHAPMTPTSMGGSPYAGAFLAANLGNLPLRPPHPSPMPNAPKTPSNSIKSDGSTLSKNSPMNLEAYCELCQKEFCNKYFLKRHKWKIHSVNIEVTIKNSKSNPPLDRPEGWCDACRRDVGSRSQLNAHKLHAHGPHIVNNMPTTEASPKHPLEFRQMNQIPLKLNCMDREVKNNFSPWDMMRERDPSEMPNNWKDSENPKIPEEANGTRKEQNDQKPKDAKQMQENFFNHIHNANSSTSMANSLINNHLSTSEASILSDGQLLPSNFNAVRKLMLPQTNGIKEPSTENHVKTEEKLPENEIKSHRNSVDIDSEPPMPILKPQVECPTSNNQCANNTSEQEERPPLLTKEQLNSQAKMEEEENQDMCHNVSEPPRTPGGVSNSTDDSSREAGIIARVGQPAIVQAPPGTKFTSEQLRQLGVINPDAFCELCCKEFCNKYFLRTHRIKKHNIYTPEYSERSKQQFKDSAPINLAKIFERHAALDFRPPGFNPIDMKVECDICRRPFPNPYLLHMHRLYFHGPAQESLIPENMHLNDHMIPHEHLRQLALQAHHQKMQDHQMFIRQQKELQEHQQQQQQRHQQQEQEQHNNPEPHQHDSQERDEEVRNHCQQLESNNKSPSIGRNDCSNIKSDAEENQTSKKSEINDRNLSLFEEDNKMNHIDSDNKEEGESLMAKTPQLSPALPENSNSSMNGEADTSEELRKLQSMILGLNRQGEESLQCKVCLKEFGNRYFLKAHMMTEHNIAIQDDMMNNSENAQTPKTPIDSNGGMTSPMNSLNSDSQAYCEICKKDFFSRYILQQHMLSSHGIFTQHPGPTSFLDRIRAEVEGREDRKPQSVSRSFCDICNKELCNKYFMKTHMLKMHGINIENGNSGGVTCDICNKELCSKYFLKVHRQNTHGLVEDISKDMKDPTCNGKEENEDSSAVEMCPICNRKFKNIKWLRSHMTQDHGEDGKSKWMEIEASLPSLDVLNRSTPSCGICGQVQSDVVSLQLHLIKYHGNQDSNDESMLEQPEPTLHCSSCSFVCRSPALLSAHERSHSPILNSLPPQIQNNTIQCNVCPQLLPSFEAYQQHLIGHQLQGLFEPLLAKTSDPEIDEGLLPPTKCLKPKSNRIRKKYKCRKCIKRFRSRSAYHLHVYTKHSRRPIYSAPHLWRRKLYRCRKCGLTKKHLGDLIGHIRSHYNRSSPSVPVTKAMPLTDPQNQHFVMQAFLMNDGNDSDFAPSIVHLPVFKKILHTLTVSFTMTPAE